MKDTEQLALPQQADLLKTLKDRFEKNMNRHQGFDWSNVWQASKNTTAKFCLTYNRSKIT